jgi:hypothetical protein
VKKPHWRSRVAFIWLLAALGLIFAAAPGLAGSTASTGHASERALKNAAEGSFDVLEQAQQYTEARTAPADSIDAGAFSGAYAAAASLPLERGSWSEITTKPYDSDAHGYRDPVWSNSGGGAGIVGGRTTALAVDGSTLYAGAADGGVWKYSGGAWTALTDDAPTLSIGALAVDSSHGLWVGTGEANTSSDSYAGVGVLYKAAGSSTFVRVGGSELQNVTIGRIVFDNGYAFAATSRGLFRHPTSTTTGPWQPVLANGLAPLASSCSQAGGVSGFAFVSDVAAKPNTGGRVVDAIVGWRAGSNCNGFYESSDYGQTFAPVNVSGAINDNDLGRTTIAYSADGSKLYAIVQSASMFNQAKTDFGGTELQGIYESNSGLGGPWTKVAEWRNLANSGSALQLSLGYHPGVQAWYNQFLTVDPADPNHLFLGLEEAFESTDGGQTWNAVGPYWNFGMPCASGPLGLDGCPPTTHPDQHAALVANGQVYVGNDGGVYTRGLDSTSPFSSINTGYRTLQYYYADAGPVTVKGGTKDAIWGGLQDNGVSLLSPGANTMVSPFGGDGGDNIVDHTNGDRAVNEYVDLDMALTTNGGRSDGTNKAYREISPSCFAYTYTPSPCDPNPRFIAPFEPDSANPDHWVAGGEFVWDNGGAGWDTTCGSSSCTWKQAYDTGAGHSITAIGVNNATYVAWCGPCNSSGFARGLATNYDASTGKVGAWHAMALPTGFPNRFIQAITVDPTDPGHVYVVFNGFSRRWTNTFSAGEGHVWETTNGGTTWTDISGNLPDAPGDDLVITHPGTSKAKLVEASDIGVFVAAAGQGSSTTWSRFGTLPHASVNDLQLSPDGSYIIAATHGRGLWKTATP